MDFETLYQDYSGPIYQLALRLLRNQEAAIDAVQETFAKAFAARQDFRGQAKPSTWLFRIAYNLCLSKLREKDSGAQGVEILEQPDSAETRPEPAAERSELGSALRLALEGLEEEERRLLCLLMEENLSYDDLASVLRCSPEALRMRICRARRKLKTLLEPLLEKIR